MKQAVHPLAGWPSVRRAWDDRHKIVLSCKYMSPWREKGKDIYLAAAAVTGGIFMVPAFYGVGLNGTLAALGAGWLGFLYLLFRLSHPWACLVGKRLRIVVTPRGVTFRGEFYSSAATPEISIEVPPEGIRESIIQQREMERLSQEKGTLLVKPYHRNSGRILLGYGPHQIKLAEAYNVYRARLLALRIQQIVAHGDDLGLYGAIPVERVPFWQRLRRKTGEGKPGGETGAEEEPGAGDEEDPFADDDEPPRRSTGRMTRSQALEILGLAEGASQAEMKAAYKRLMTKVHPDIGGTDHFAKQLNAAKEVLGF